ncbi:Protein of unknown function DUF3537 [Dillenia turbinata]|uniref:Uncharacterized protein n=1 Tax=Dillenia turbinata TaxID=194707 RepID=A0AAN8VC89_9MAGN
MSLPRPQSQTPLLNTLPPLPKDPSEIKLSTSIQNLELFLKFFGFCQYTPLSFSLSWLSFILIGIVTPILVLQFAGCSNCQQYQVESFELEILISQSIVSTIALVCISRSLCKYGVRKFLFVDRYHGETLQFRDEYIKRIIHFFHFMAWWFLPCFIIKTTREVLRLIYVKYDSWLESVSVLIALIVSWTYSTIVYLSANILFSLVCNLQVIHFENYGKLLERDLDVSLYIEEHMRLVYYLSKISHRFRIYLVFEFWAVTASLFMFLLETTGNSGINFINGGDFVVASIVQVFGVMVCLHAATKISHRAQGIVAVAARWHALATSNSSDGSTTTNGGWNPDGSTTGGSLTPNYSESDLESLEYVIPAAHMPASHMSSYYKRQAFVTYLRTNTGGVTIFGWTVDRALINTIFFIQLSLVTFVLGKTITISSS